MKVCTADSNPKEVDIISTYIPKELSMEIFTEATFFSKFRTILISSQSNYYMRNMENRR
jgi:hypothetical protein